MGALGHEQNPPQLGGFPLQEHGSPACSWLPRKIEQELLLDYFSLILVPEDPHISPYDLQTRRQQMPDLIIHIRMPAEADLLKPCRKMIFFFSNTLTTNRGLGHGFLNSQVFMTEKFTLT